jgi:hypothetical protein
MQPGWSARQTCSRDLMSSTSRGGDDGVRTLPEAAREAIGAVLDSAESIEFVAPAVGSSLVLTQHRLVVVRDGASFRPKTGVRSFELASGVAIRIGPGRRRVIIESGGKTINLFVRSEQLGQAEAFVAEVRRRIYGDG